MDIHHTSYGQAGGQRWIGPHSNFLFCFQSMMDRCWKSLQKADCIIACVIICCLAPAVVVLSIVISKVSLKSASHDGRWYTTSVILDDCLSEYPVRQRLIVIYYAFSSILVYLSSLLTSYVNRSCIKLNQVS